MPAIIPSNAGQVTAGSHNAQTCKQGLQDPAKQDKRRSSNLAGGTGKIIECCVSINNPGRPRDTTDTRRVASAIQFINEFGSRRCAATLTCSNPYTPSSVPGSTFASPRMMASPCRQFRNWLNVRSMSYCSTGLRICAPFCEITNGTASMRNPETPSCSQNPNPSVPSDFRLRAPRPLRQRSRRRTNAHRRFNLWGRRSAVSLGQRQDHTIPDRQRHSR
jgi:hypothetical protein